VKGTYWTSFHSGGVGSLRGNVLKSGCLGSRGVVRLGVIETIRGGDGDTGLTGGSIGSSGRNDDETTGGDLCRVSLGNGGMSHGRGMRSSDEGAVIFRIGGVGILSGVGDLFHGVGMTGVASLNGGDGVSDWGNGTSTGSSVIIGGGSYCSMDEYSRRCDPQGTRGSGGVAARGGSTSGGLGGVGTNGGANDDGSTRGGNGTLGTMGDNGLTTEVDDSGFEIVIAVPPPPPEGPGRGMNIGDGDLLLIVFLRLLRSV